MMDQITEAQFVRWMDVYRRHPFGPAMDWRRHGTIASMIGNTAPNRRRGSKQFKPEDFIPGSRKERPVKDDAALRGMFRAMAANARKA